MSTNQPPIVNVLRFTGAGPAAVYPLLSTQILGAKIGADVGTGTATIPTMESPAAGTISTNRVVEFLNDSFCLIEGLTNGGVFRRDQGGANQWGRVLATIQVPTAVSGLFVIQVQGGAPTLAFLEVTTGFAVLIHTTTNGTTWNTVNHGQTLNAASYGHAVLFRESLFWVTSSAGGFSVWEYNFNLNTFTPIDISPPFVVTVSQGASFTLHVHDNTLFLAGFSLGGTSPAMLAKLQAGSFVQVGVDSTTQRAGSWLGHSVMFTDPATGDLITVWTGANAALSPGTRVEQTQNATGSPTVIDVTSTVMGAVQGADKYLPGGGSADGNRRWTVLVDNDSNPLAPRVFLWTWTAGFPTECWEWRGVGAEMELVNTGLGISDEFAFPHNSLGGGHRTPRQSAVELGDAGNPPLEEAGGTRVYFRGQGSVVFGTVTFYGTDSEGTPQTVIPILAGTFVIESGAPPTTPSIVGNTLINFTPDNGATLYSVRLQVDAVGVDIDEGEYGMIVADFV
jgi:hypothetical protein